MRFKGERFERKEMMMDKAMPMAMPAMAMEDEAFDEEEDEMPMEMGGAPAAPAPKETGTGSEEEDPASMDFMSSKEIKPNTREYAHHLRAKYDKFTRIDYT
jgi:hypothetical protein